MWRTDRTMASGPVTPPDVDFSRLFSGLPTAFMVMNRDFVIVEANPAYSALVGFDRQELIGHYVFDIFPPDPQSLAPDGSNPAETSFRNARDTGRPDTMPLFKYAIPDPVDGKRQDRFWSFVSAPILDDLHRTLWIVQRVEDVTDWVRGQAGPPAAADTDDTWQRRVQQVEADLFLRLQELRAAEEARARSARRLASLAEVALQLAGAESLQDLQEIIAGTGLAVLGAAGGALYIRQFADQDAPPAVASLELGPQVPMEHAVGPEDNPLPLYFSARTGERVLLPTVAAGLAFTPEMLRVYDAVQRKAWAVFPLGVGSQRLGSLAVSWQQEREFDSEEIDLLEGFAAQWAQTLLRIEVSKAEREAALAVRRFSETLQRSLLTQPAVGDFLEVAVRYQPAAQEAQIGGDWYDAFVCARGDTVLVVGDITGHDRAAAAAMAQVRNLLRGLAYDSDEDPADLLNRLDGAMEGLELDTLATAVLARLERDVTPGQSGLRRLIWSNAGHPPPLLCGPDGTVRMLKGPPDLLLGQDPQSSRRDHVVELEPGSTLLLYTDGLIERRDSDLDQGIAALAAALTRHAAAKPDLLCERLLTEMQLQGNEDDAVLLVVRLL